jgi:hypothetical protein
MLIKPLASAETCTDAKVYRILQQNLEVASPVIRTWLFGFDITRCFAIYNLYFPVWGGVSEFAQQFFSAKDSFSGLNLNTNDALPPMNNLAVQRAASVMERKCVMHFCRCEAPKQEPAPTKVDDNPIN